MIEWLQNYSGMKTSGPNMERVELENLRKEMNRYKKKYAKEDEEMAVHSGSESEDEDKEDQDKVDQIIAAKKTNVAAKGQRASVSAEVYGAFNKKEAFVAKVYAKTEEQRNRIISKVTQSFLFNSLEEKDLNTVIDAFVEKTYKPGEAVITQGEQGDVLYLIEKGELDCHKILKKGEEPTWLKVYHPGEAFGELALLYNAPRAATITAKSDSILWALDRETFNNIVKDAAMKKREKYENFLKSVDILQTIDPYELSQISDALQTKKVKAGEEIIKQNDPGNEFYIIEEGEAFASKIFEDGKSDIVKEYLKGGYFGELALIKNEPRAASVIAKTDCRLLTLDRMSFKRLLGPLENLLKRNSTAYVKYLQK
jgi:cAMP-dependent protein kinase regulator